MPTPAELLAQSLAKFQTANRIDGNKNSYRKDNPNEYAAVMAYLAGGTRPTSVTSDMGLGLVLEEDARRALLAGPTGATGATGATGSTGATGAPGPYPASYYTGPLGERNILPADPDGALLILWAGDINFTNATWKTRVQERESACGRTFDGIGVHYGGGGTFGGVANCAWINPSDGKEQWIHDRGSVPIISWSPNASIAQVNSGTFDACFTNVANHFKQFNFKLMLRMWWEFDGNWMTWKATVGEEAAWISAWRRVVGLFKAAGASNVGFWWCPTEGFNRTLASACYPGDAFVDWVGSDCYNQATPTVWTYPLRAGWGEFWELFNYTGHGTSIVCKHNEFGPRKPYVVGETGSLYDSATPSRKANWYRSIDSHAYGLQGMPYLCGVQFFDVNLVTTEGFDWKVDNNQTYTQKQAKVDGSLDPTTYQGFKDFAATARWNVGVA